LDIYTSNPVEISTPMLETAQAITAQMALTLQNIHLLADAQRRAEQLQRVTIFSQSVQASLELPTILDIALTECRQMLTQDAMRIALYDPTTAQLRVAARLTTEGARSVDLSAGEIMPITGPVAEVWQDWKPLYIPDLLESHTEFEGDGLRSLMMTPILTRGRALGLVGVGCLRPYAYSETDLSLFQQMVNQLAVAIENAEAYAQSQRLVKNEALVNIISTQLQRQSDISSMLDVTINELGRAIGARRARIRLGYEAPGPKPTNGEEG
jgi:formate hydrogenlyase transcriptional activator